ncbi:hypothetical protein PV327_001881, partial [Microctonus hyperodae]
MGTLDEVKCQLTSWNHNEADINRRTLKDNDNQTFQNICHRSKSFIDLPDNGTNWNTRPTKITRKLKLSWSDRIRPGRKAKDISSSLYTTENEITNDNKSNNESKKLLETNNTTDKKSNVKVKRSDSFLKRFVKSSKDNLSVGCEKLVKNIQKSPRVLRKKILSNENHPIAPVRLKKYEKRQSLEATKFPDDCLQFPNELEKQKEKEIEYKEEEADTLIEDGFLFISTSYSFAPEGDESLSNNLDDTLSPRCKVYSSLRIDEYIESNERVRVEEEEEAKRRSSSRSISVEDVDELIRSEDNFRLLQEQSRIRRKLRNNFDATIKTSDSEESLCDNSKINNKTRKRSQSCRNAFKVHLESADNSPRTPRRSVRNKTSLDLFWKIKQSLRESTGYRDIRNKKLKNSPPPEDTTITSITSSPKSFHTVDSNYRSRDNIDLTHDLCISDRVTEATTNSQRLVSKQNDDEWLVDNISNVDNKTCKIVDFANTLKYKVVGDSAKTSTSLTKVGHTLVSAEAQCRTETQVDFPNELGVVKEDKKENYLPGLCLYRDILSIEAERQVIQCKRNNFVDYCLNNVDEESRCWSMVRECFVSPMRSSSESNLTVNECLSSIKEIESSLQKKDDNTEKDLRKFHQGKRNFRKSSKNKISFKCHSIMKLITKMMRVKEKIIFVFSAFAILFTFLLVMDLQMDLGYSGHHLVPSHGKVRMGDEPGRDTVYNNFRRKFLQRLNTSKELTVTDNLSSQTSRDNKIGENSNVKVDNIESTQHQVDKFSDLMDIVVNGDGLDMETGVVRIRNEDYTDNPTVADRRGLQL